MHLFLALLPAARADTTFNLVRGSADWQTTREAVTLADLDEDGRDELIVARPDFDTHATVIEAHTFSAALGLSVLSSIDVGGLASVTGLVAADVNNDGHQDVIVARDSLRILLGDGSGALVLGPRKSGSFQAIAVGDVDGDGDVDIATPPDCGDQFYAGNGDGTFESRLVPVCDSAAEYGLELADVTGDGDLDLLATAQGGGVVVFPFGADTFDIEPTVIPTVHAGWTALAAGDLGGDGLTDVALLQIRSYHDNYLTTLHQENGQLVADTPTSVTGAPPLRAADLDQDGDDDLVGFNDVGYSVWLQEAGGLGPEQVIRTLPQESPDAMAVGEVTGDGCLDVVTLSSQGLILALGACATNDADGDGTNDAADPCPFIANASEEDSDGDGEPDACDSCPGEPNQSWNDMDHDGISDMCDVCATIADDGADSDGDGRGDACDPCPTSPNVDEDYDDDGDGVANGCDNCPDLANDQADGDADSIGDPCDLCPGWLTGDQINDWDDDGVGNACDACNTLADDQADGDGDGAGDACDVCAGLADNQWDGDDDGFGDACDVCPAIADDQTDSDGDGVGDACPEVADPGCRAGCRNSGSEWPTAAVLLLFLRRRR